MLQRTEHVWRQSYVFQDRGSPRPQAEDHDLLHAGNLEQSIGDFVIFVAATEKPFFPAFLSFEPQVRDRVDGVCARRTRGQNGHATTGFYRLMHALLSWFDSTACTPILAPLLKIVVVSGVYGWMRKNEAK